MNKKIVSTHQLSSIYTLLPAVALAAITALIYYPSLHYEFQFDDVPNILKHFNLRHYALSDLMFSGSRWIVSWINSLHYAFGKFDPFSYRLLNVIIHACNGLLIYTLFNRLLRRTQSSSFFNNQYRALSFITALLFLLHPVQTQTVSYVIQGQLEGLALLFILLIINVFIVSQTTNNPTHKKLALLAIFTLIPFSCSTKEIAIISPALLLLIDWFFLSKGDWRVFKKRWLLYALYCTSVIGIYLFYLKPSFFTDILGFKHAVHNNVGNIITHTPQALITPWNFFISQFKVIVHYLVMFVWPFSISVEYDWKLCTHFLALDCIVPFIVLLSLVAFVFYLLRRSHTHLIAFGFVWFFVCILPRSSIIPSSELLVDYKTYMSSIGIMFLLASALVWIYSYLRLRAQWLHYAALCSLALLLGVHTMQRNTVWRSTLEFWHDVIIKAPKKARAYNNYGVELALKQRKYQQALPYFYKAIELDRYYPDAYNNVAVVYSLLGNPDKAIEILNHCMKLNPSYPEGYNNLASFYIKKKEFDTAEKLLHTALKLRPHYGKVYYNLCTIYVEKGQPEKAWEFSKLACTKADLDTDAGFYTFGSLSFSLKKFDDALWAFKKVLELNPHFKDTHFQIANCYFYQQQFELGAYYYEQAYVHNPTDLRALYNLAETQFVMNNPTKALETFKKLEPHFAQFPNAMVRIAACYEKMGDPMLAYKTLSGYQQSTSSVQHKNALAQLMREMEKRYKFA